jgi:YfiH family protein
MGLRLATVPELSALPGLVHGFERRRVPTLREERAETLSRVRAALGPSGRLLLMRQVHGTVVLRAPWEGTPEADAALTDGPGLILGVATADCLPILLVDPARGAVAATHAGWRGTAAGVTARTVEALVAGGSRPDDLAAAIGPGIGSCCYEVGEELRDAFVGGDAFFRPGPRGRPHLDVRAANASQLREAGVRADRIHHVDECTSCLPDLYYSYRRDGKGTGRMISFIGWTLPSPS